MHQKQNISSPCIKLCEVDNETQLCKGCFRNIDEITTFPFLNDESKIKLNETLAKRRKHLLNLKQKNPGKFEWVI
jgi:predicted Fe-S protein YdhL (DUF1289 family)